MTEVDESILLKTVCNVYGLVDYATKTKTFDPNPPSVETGGLEQYYAVCPACVGGANEKKFIKKSLYQG